MTSFLCSQVFELNKRFDALSNKQRILIDDLLRTKSDVETLKNQTVYNLEKTVVCIEEEDLPQMELRLRELESLKNKISKLEYLVDLIGNTDNSEQVDNLEKRVYDILNAQGNRDGRVQALELKLREIESK